MDQIYVYLCHGQILPIINTWAPSLDSAPAAFRATEVWLGGTITQGIGTDPLGSFHGGFPWFDIRGCRCRSRFRGRRGAATRCHVRRRDCRAKSGWCGVIVTNGMSKGDGVWKYREIGARFNLESIQIGVRPTGSWHLQLERALSRRGAHVARVNFNPL